MLQLQFFYTHHSGFSSVEFFSPFKNKRGCFILRCQSSITVITHNVVAMFITKLYLYYEVMLEIVNFLLFMLKYWSKLSTGHLVYFTTSHWIVWFILGLFSCLPFCISSYFTICIKLFVVLLSVITWMAGASICMKNAIQNFSFKLLTPVCLQLIRWIPNTSVKIKTA